jgi:uncharacterized protein YjdB
MKKTLLFFQSLLLVCLFSIVGASSAWAEDLTATFTFNAAAAVKALGITAPASGKTVKVTSVSTSPITITTSNAVVGNTSNVYTFRVYANSTLTISTTSDYIITGIAFAAADKDKAASNFSTTTGTLTTSSSDKLNTTWSGETSSIVFKTSKQVRLNSIVVTYKEVTTETTEKTTTTLSYTSTQTIKQTKTLEAPIVTVADKSGAAIEGASVTWASSNTSVATVNATTGEVKGIGLGTATITASYAGNDTYGKSSASYDVEVIENVAETTTMTLSYAATDTATVKQDATLPAPTVTVTAKSGTVVENPTITWTSANTAIATVDASTGVVTGTGVGITTITATFAANDTYGTSSASYDVMVVDKDGVHTLIFKATGGQKDVGGYFSEWYANMGKGDATFSYALDGFNNNNSKWDVIKSGSRSGDTNPMISNTTPFEKYVESIDITIDSYSESATGDNFYYIISDDADFKTVKDSVAFTIKASTSAQTVTLKPTYPGKYIKIGGKIGTTTSNGTLIISKLVYTESTKAATTLTLSSTKETLGFKKTLTAPTATVTATEDGTTIDGATVKWKSYNTDIATVDETTGEVSTVDLGTATIVALYAGNDTYQPATATYEVEVKSNAKVTTVKTSLTGQNQVKVGKTLTATATVTTEDGAIDGAAVTWSSSNTDVATVDEYTGVVTGVGIGTATITASFTGDNLSYTSSSTSYTVIVGGLTFKHVDKVTSGRQYMIVGVATEGGNLYAVQGDTKLSSAYISANEITPNEDGTLSTTDNLSVFTLTGNDTDGYYLQQTADNKYIYTKVKDDGTTMYNKFYLTKTESDAAKWMITADNDGSMKFVNASYPDTYYLSLYYYESGAKWQMYNDTKANQGSLQLYELQSDETLYVQTEEAYATYYTEEAYIMPEGLKGSSISDAADDGTLTLPYEYAAGDIVPAKTALLIKADAKGKYPIYGTFAAATTTVTTNLLHGVSADTKITHDDKRFILTYSTVEGTKTLGFYTTASGNMTVLANRAYLELTSAVTSPVAGFAIPDGPTTGIEAAQTAAAPSAIYTLSGTRVKSTTTEGLPAGIYIVDGKKVFVK